MSRSAYFTKALIGLAAIAGQAAAAQPASGDPDLAHVLLEEHNAARGEFGAPTLAWSDRLSREAQAWADTLADHNRMVHSDRKVRQGAGENLWMGTRGYFPLRQRMAAFVNERRDFKPGTFPQVSRTGRWSDVGHYTQIVWPQTREVGCAVAANDQNEFLVCRYWPAGNVIGQKLAPKRALARR